MLLMPGFADRQGMPVDGKSAGGRSRLHDLDAFGHDFEADIVAEENSDFQMVTPTRHLD
jgi:hypothetical protein